MKILDLWRGMILVDDLLLCTFLKHTLGFVFYMNPLGSDIFQEIVQYTLLTQAGRLQYGTPCVFFSLRKTTTTLLSICGKQVKSKANG